MDWNVMNDKEFGSIELLRLKYRRGGPNNSDILQNWFPPEISPPPPPPSLICRNLKTLRSTPESYKMHWNLMNDKEFGSKKLLKLKYRRGDQIIQTFGKIGSPQVSPSSLICRNFRTLRKAFLVHAEWTEM